MSFTTSIQDSLDSLALRFKTLSNDETITFEQLSTIDKELGDLLERYQQFKNIQTFLDDEELQDLKIDIQNLKYDLQNKLDTNYYKGEKGTSISNLSTSNNELIVSLDDGRDINLGNFVNDYRSLTNKPSILDLDDYELGSFTPYFFTDDLEFSNNYGTRVGKYVKYGKLVHVYVQLSADTFNSFNQDSIFKIGGLPFSNNGVFMSNGVVSNLPNGTSFAVNALLARNVDFVVFLNTHGYLLKVSDFNIGNRVVYFNFSYLVN